MEYLDYPKEKVDIFSPCDKNYFLKSDRFFYLCSYEEAENTYIVARWFNETDRH